MISFEFPAYSPIVKLDLSSPVKGDDINVENELRITLTRDNTQRSYAHKKRSKIIRLDFTGIKKSKRVEIMDFFRGVGSNYILYTDYIPRPIANSNPIQYTFNKWILSLLEDIAPTSIQANKFEFTVVARRWPA